MAFNVYIIGYRFHFIDKNVCTNNHDSTNNKYICGSKMQLIFFLSLFSGVCEILKLY